MADAQGLIAAYVTQMQRFHAQNTRGIATPEQRHAWTMEAIAVLDGLKAEAWDEGAEEAWSRSTPLVNGLHYHWRTAGEPLNPYRAAKGGGR